MARSFSDKLAHVTGGRRYCFVIMTYHGSYAFFERIRSIVTEVAGLAALAWHQPSVSDKDRRSQGHDNRFLSARSWISHT